MATFSRQATVDWNGDVMHGAGIVTAGTAAFTLPVTYPHVGGEASGDTTPEEMLAASHASCFAIGLRSVIGQRGGRAKRVSVTTTITAEKRFAGIRIRSSHLRAIVDGLEGIEHSKLREIAQATEEGCTISIAIRESVAITSEIAAS
jgi:osmotically inducible protein OsmC